MPIWTRDTQPNSILRSAAVLGPTTFLPVGDSAAICASQAMTLNVPLLLNGLGVVNSGLSAILPVPLEPSFTPAVNTDTFTLTIVGLDTQGLPLTVVQAHASGVVTQRLAAQFIANGQVMFSRIDSITPTSITVVTGNITVGWKFAQAADGGAAGSNQVQRIPLLVPGPKQGDVLGLYVLDGGGGTFAAGNAQGAMLKLGLATFSFGPSVGPVLYATYAGNPSVLPTRPCTYIPLYKPGVVGKMTGSSGII